MDTGKDIRLAVDGYGVIGKRVADAVAEQDDMQLVGVADIAADWRPRVAMSRGMRLFGATAEHADAMRKAGLEAAGILEDLLGQTEIIVDCTPKKVAARNVELYRQRGLKFIVEGGEKHSVTGHSFVAEANHASAFGRDATRVSCNTTSVVRTLSALRGAGLLRKARGTLLRRATDPWESRESGIMNTLVPEAGIPSHQGPDAQTVDPEVDVITMAVKVHETLAHVHYRSVEMTRAASKDEVLAALRTSTRIALIRYADGLPALNAMKELMSDTGRRRADLYEVALWEDMLKVPGNELIYGYRVDNQAIVIPETVDAIRALTRAESDGSASIGKTNATLGIGTWRW